LDIFAKNSLTVSKPKLWDASFENFLHKEVATIDE